MRAPYDGIRRSASAAAHSASKQRCRRWRRGAVRRRADAHTVWVRVAARSGGPAQRTAGGTSAGSGTASASAEADPSEHGGSEEKTSGREEEGPGLQASSGGRGDGGLQDGEDAQGVARRCTIRSVPTEGGGASASRRGTRPLSWGPRGRAVARIRHCARGWEGKGDSECLNGPRKGEVQRDDGDGPVAGRWRGG